MRGHDKEAQAANKMTHLPENKMTPLFKNQMGGASPQTKNSVLNFVGLGALASLKGYLPKAQIKRGRQNKKKMAANLLRRKPATENVIFFRGNDE